MKEKIVILLEKYKIKCNELSSVSKIPYSSLLYILYKSESHEIREDLYKKIFEGLYLLAQKRIVDGYNLDHELDNLDTKLHYEVLLKNDKNNL